MKQQPRFSYCIVIEYPGINRPEHSVKYGQDLCLHDALAGMRAYLRGWGTIPVAHVWSMVSDADDRKRIDTLRQDWIAKVQP